MRIIHLSDIHLSSENIQELRLHYLNSLIQDLKKINREKEIDLIIISGDLVDKGGDSLLKIKEYEGFINPYEIFEKEFINPICEGIPFLKQKLLFIAGNHDIERNKIHEFIEEGLKSKSKTSKNVNDYCSKYKDNLDNMNFQRIENFLQFEKKYHTDNKFINYVYSDFESKVIYEYAPEKNIGISLINDSWRCSEGTVQNHFVGTNQFHQCLNFFKENKTCFNIAVVHHPLECLNENEKEEIESILHNFPFEILLIGHEHKTRVQKSDIGNNKTILFTRGKSAFNKPHETHLDYISGYSYIDINFDEKLITCNFKIYDKNNFKFENQLEHGTSKREFTYGIPEKKINENYSKKEKFIYDFDKSNFINNPENEE